MTESCAPLPADGIESNDPFGRKLSTTKPDIQGWAVRTGSTPFAVRSSDEEWPEENFNELHSYAGGIAWAVHNLGEEWDLVASTAGVGAYRLRLHVEPVDEGSQPVGRQRHSPTAGLPRCNC